MEGNRGDTVNKREIYNNIEQLLDSGKISEDEELFRKRMAKHIIYDGRALPVLFYPYILNRREFKYIKEVCERMTSIIDNLIDDLIETDVFREVFEPSPVLEKLVKKDPGYSGNITKARYDSFFYGDSLKFHELNAEGIAGFYWNDMLNSLFRESETFRDLFDGRFKRFEMVDGVLDHLLKCFEEFSGGLSRKPKIGILDYGNVKTYEEFRGFKRRFEEKGFPTYICEPEELRYTGEELKYGKTKLDIVYRRMLTVEYLGDYENNPALGDAYLDGNICLVEPFRAYIGFSKKLFVLLSSEKVERFLNEKEKKFVEKHIPFTRMLSDRNIVYQNETRSIKNLLLENKDDFVIKPAEQYDGAGVYVGKLMEEDKWREAVERNMDRHFLVQKYLEPPVWDTPEGEHYIHLGEYLIDGKLSGFMTRSGKEIQLSPESRERKTPTFALRSS